MHLNISIQIEKLLKIVLFTSFGVWDDNFRLQNLGHFEFQIQQLISIWSNNYMYKTRFTVMHQSIIENCGSMNSNFWFLTSMVHAMNAAAFNPSNKGVHGSTHFAEWHLQQEGEFHDIPCISCRR
jgi:hypothetical protein